MLGVVPKQFSEAAADRQVGRQTRWVRLEALPFTVGGAREKLQTVCFSLVSWLPPSFLTVLRMLACICCFFQAVVVWVDCVGNEWMGTVCGGKDCRGVRCHKYCLVGVHFMMSQITSICVMLKRAREPHGEAALGNRLCTALCRQESLYDGVKGRRREITKATQSSAFFVSSVGVSFACSSGGGKGSVWCRDQREEGKEVGCFLVMLATTVEVLCTVLSKLVWPVDV